MRPRWTDLTGRARALRIAHGLIAAVGLASLGCVWFCGVSRRRNAAVRASVAWLMLQGIAVVLGRGNCPLGPLQTQLGDPTPCFELVLPPRAAKAVFPTLLPIALAGLGLLVLRRPRDRSPEHRCSLTPTSGPHRYGLMGLAPGPQRAEAPVRRCQG